MGQGGSATSGRGLTGIQVAAALRVTAASQLRHYRDRQAQGDWAASAAGQRDLRRTPSGITGALDDLGGDAFADRRQHEVSAPAAGGGGGGGAVQVRVTEFAPEVFRVIRAVEDVEEDFFADEWTLPEERLKMELGEGRSQALFLKSKTMAFMCKTIALGEVEVLLDILRAYAAHTANEPNSLLMRFYMLLKVQVQDEVGYVLCFNDVFGNAESLNEKWDIKGRIPKPGKYQYFPHLVRTAHEPDPHIIDTPRDDAAAGSGEHRDDVVVVKEEEKHKVVTHKDKDLTRLFWLDRAERERVVGQLLSDYAFLGSVGLMDYSLLIGVSYKESKHSHSGKRYVVIKNMKMAQMLGAEDDTNAVEVRPASPRTRGRSASNQRPVHDPVCEFAAGVHSLFDQEIYYIGVIDMLTKYGAAKKVANFCKSFLWHENTLSTIPPPEYQERISSFTKIVFPLEAG